MKTTKFFWVLKNKKGKYLTSAFKRTRDISKARRFKQYEAFKYKSLYSQIGNEDRIIKAQITTTIKEVK